MEDPASPLDFGRAPVYPSTVEPGLSSEPPPLSGVDGNIKQAFGDRATGRNLRDDLLLAADNVTSAMSSLVRELNSGTYFLRLWILKIFQLTFLGFVADKFKTV